MLQIILCHIQSLPSVHKSIMYNAAEDITTCHCHIYRYHSMTIQARLDGLVVESGQVSWRRAAWLRGKQLPYWGSVEFNSKWR